jgi:hypothetical protein
MKFRVFALILSLALSMSMTGWAQDAPATAAAPNSTPAPKAEGCCHHNMADMKDGKGCCHQAAADAKDAMSCCGKDKDKCEAKDGKSCCAGKDMKAEMKECKKNGCCKDAKSCGEAKGDKTAAGCCGNKCEHHPQTPAGI